MFFIGQINPSIFCCVSDNILTKDVIITSERISHIKERHPLDYERFYTYLTEIITNPDYIIESNKSCTAILLKEIPEENIKFKVILRLVSPVDPPEYKNSVISFWRIGDVTWNKILKIKKCFTRENNWLNIIIEYIKESLR